ncbi:MAG: type toxin-antitoxin system death-on-curing family toxin [Phenylobacterium sp.]|nr:type toxin-antitoxin system death-on-curing family toxin [Phenylobacterium sp.]
MAEPVWLDKALVLALYEDLVAASGGAAGLLSEGLLESALARPMNRRLYDGVDDLLDLAATYAVGIASNHAFLDGNKRIAFLALGQFLIDNGIVLTANDDDTIEVMLGVARSEVGIDQLREWLRSRTVTLFRAG